MKKIVRIAAIVCLFCSVLVVPLRLAAEPVREKAKAEEGRLRVTADLLAVFPDKNFTEFTGHVQAFYQGRILRCVRLRAYFSKDAKDLNRIEAEEQVVLIDKEIEAHCDRAIFYRDRDVVVLSGTPRLKSGGSEFRGEIITVNLTTRRLTIEGGVEADIIPPESKSK